MKHQRRSPQHQQQPRLVVRLHPEIFEASRLPSFAAVTGNSAFKYAAATSGQDGGSAAAAAASGNTGSAAAAAASAFAAAAQRETILVSTAAAAVAGAAALTRRRQREKSGSRLVGDKQKKCLTAGRTSVGTAAEPPSEEMKKSVASEKSKRSEVYQRQLQQLEAAVAADDKALVQLLHNEEERLRQIKLREAEEERQRHEKERQRQEEERRRQEEERQRQERHAREVAAAAAAQEEQQRLERQAPENERQRRVEEEARLRKQQEEEQRRLAEEQQKEERRRLQLLLQEQQAQQQRQEEERQRQQREDEQRGQEKETQQQQQAQEAQNRLHQEQQDVKQQEIQTSQGKLELAEEAREIQLETASSAAVSATNVLPALDPAKPETAYIRDVLLLLAEDRRMREAQLLQLPGVSEDQVKALRISIKKQINTALNQLASTTSQVIRTCEGIRQYMRELKVHPPEVSQYFMAQACERLLQLTEKGGQVSTRPSSVWAYAFLIRGLIQEDERVERMFRAHVYATCCYAAPFYYRKKQGVSVEEFRATRGQRDGEDEEAFFSRMAACLRLWLSFLIASHKEEEAWSWLARFLNLNLATAKAARRVCACAMVEGLKIAGPALLKAYGRQFKKIMDLIQNSLMPLLLAMQQKNEGTCISMYVTQLRTLVSDYYANNCTLPDPEGKSMKMESTEASPDI